MPLLRKGYHFLLLQNIFLKIISFLEDVLCRVYVRFQRAATYGCAHISKPGSPAQTSRSRRSASRRSPISPRLPGFGSAGRPFISDGWNIFDIIVVGLSLVALGPVAMPINVLRCSLLRSPACRPRPFLPSLPAPVSPLLRSPFSPLLCGANLNPLETLGARPTRTDLPRARRGITMTRIGGGTPKGSQRGRPGQVDAGLPSHPDLRPHRQPPRHHHGAHDRHHTGPARLTVAPDAAAPHRL